MSSTAETRTRNPSFHTAFEKDIVGRIVGPILDEVIADDPRVDSVSGLHRAFLDQCTRMGHPCSVSPATFSRWLDMLGVTIDRRVVVTRRTAPQPE